MRAYDSYGAVDPVADEKDLRRSLEQGFRGIKIKGGDGDLANDERVVKAVRALDRSRHRADARFQPVARSRRGSRRIARLAAYDLHWIEEPVPQKILKATPRCARRLPSQFSPAKIGGFRVASRKRSRSAPATSSCRM